MRKSLFAFLFIFQFLELSAQSNADSIERFIQNTREDSTRIRLYKELGDFYVKTEPQQALRYSKEGVALSQSKALLQWLPDLYFNLGYAFNSLGDNDSAILYLGKSYDIAKGRKNTVVEVKCLNLVGSIYTTRAQYKEAAEALFKALSIAEESRNTGQTALVNSALSVLFYNQTNYEKAIAYGEKALQILRKEGDPKPLGTSYLNVGLIYADKGDNAKAEEYYKNALELFKKIDAKLHIATTYGNLSLLESIDINQKISYLLAAQKIWDEVAPDHPNAVGNLGNLGTTYFAAIRDTNFAKLTASEGIVKDKNFLLSKAEQLLTEACEKCRKLEFDRDLHYFTGQLAKVEEAKGNYKLANQYLNEYITLNDSIYSQENKNKIAAVEGEREVAIRDKQIELNKIAISAQRKVRIALIAGLALLVIIIAMLFRQSRIRRRMNTTLQKLNTELDEANKVKARFFGIISHDLRSPVANLMTFLNLQRDEPELFSETQAATHRAAITASAASLLETMEAMLQWSKSQMENFKPQLKTIRIETVFDQLKKSFPNTNTLQITFENPENITLKTDEDYLRTILYNLTANAAKALQNNTDGKIEWRAGKERNKVFLTIHDNGPGASEEQVSALYNDAAAINGKNGLGLHLVRDLAKAIDCEIQFSSEAGNGATFTLVLMDNFVTDN